jgi:hypothetical protein
MKKNVDTINMDSYVDVVNLTDLETTEKGDGRQ